MTYGVDALKLSLHTVDTVPCDSALSWEKSKENPGKVDNGSPVTTDKCIRSTRLPEGFTRGSSTRALAGLGQWF